MSVPIFWDGDRMLSDGEVEAIQAYIRGVYSRDLWRYVCELGVACDRVDVDGLTDEEWLFEWFIFVIDGQKYPWNPDDGFDVPEGEMAVVAALAARLLKRTNALAQYANESNWAQSEYRTDRGLTYRLLDRFTATGVLHGPAIAQSALGGETDR